jgi:hypothetical protein
MANEYLTIKQTITYQIDIVFDGRLFFYNRRENGLYAVNGDLISRERAKEIYEANEARTVYRIGKVSFDADASSFSWTAEIKEIGG